MRRALLCMAGFLALVGCKPADRSPDAIRQDTAKATSSVVRDAKAVAKGVADGLKAKGPVNINKASEEDLETLPGIDASAARRIIDGRPYDNASDLPKRHIVTREEYDRIAGNVVAQ
ncbi:MAG: helix-hairpin-helix domain-containing protein [Terracidiphilus sp.]